jgi:pyruvate dehydrogenase E2 component (dihydrolipoamide acetyltransferase)
VARIEIHVPDIGDYEDIPVIEILVSPGDTVSTEDPLITLESDKATMDVPAPTDGVIVSIEVAVGDSVSKGTLLAIIDTVASDSTADEDAVPAPRLEDEDDLPPPTQTDHLEVCVPDIGDFSEIPVIEVMVAPGDRVSTEDPLVTLESDKATMDVPAPADGVVREVLVRVGDSVSQGTALLIMDPDSSEDATSTPVPVSGPQHTPTPTPSTAPPPARVAEISGPRPAPTATLKPGDAASTAHASPSVRRFARELGVELTRVVGTGRKGRVLREDVKGFVKAQLAAPSPNASAQVTGVGAGIPPIPAVDFSRFGATDTQPLSRIQRLSGPHLHRAWLNVPHVTHHDEADITELEAFRKSLKDEAGQRGLRVTVLSFMMKAVATAMREFPAFNASLSPDGQSIIYKQYFNIGVAVETPGGLVVPVVRNVDTKTVYDLAADLGDVSARARDGKLKPDDLQGGCISISSLGGIGGTSFTPIVNAPEVAILGVARARMSPVWDQTEFVPRLMLPLDLSYDHRVIDGAAAARFVAYLATVLGDVRRLLL